MYNNIQTKLLGISVVMSVFTLIAKLFGYEHIAAPIAYTVCVVLIAAFIFAVFDYAHRQTNKDSNDSNN